MRLGDFSFLVSEDVQAKVMAQMPMVDSIFCGRVCTKTRCICNSSSCCLNDAQLTTIDSYPDFVNYHGIVQLPGLACKANQLATYHLDTFTTQCTDCPAGTYAYNENQISECRICPATMYSLAGSMNCTACPAGTYGNQPRQQQCISCPAGSIAPDVASMHCQPCSSGLSSNDGTRCETASLLWVAGVCGGVGGGLLVVGLLLLWWAQTYGKRNNRAAPKNASQPFCIVFTDIQSSTSLWATIPDVMAGALDAHHALIRKLIAKHRCYEVKTIGDSFMCATRSPATAVQFAVALQREFFAYRWGTDAIDTEYLRAQEGGPGWGGEHKGWNGLRVRVGIHYGMGDIELDPVSRGYDYYGTVVNTAARVEAVCHGGQIGVTQAVYNALKGELHGTVWTDLGEHLLRGLSEPLQLHQVLPAELGIRVFPPLRLQLVDDDTHVAGLKKDSILEEGGNPWDRHSVTTVATVAASWVLAHPLVRSGQFTAEDLTMRYHTVLKALTTLLGTQTKRLRELAVAGFCERLHVRHCGSDGPRLEETLHGLVQRVLPAALMAVPAGAGLDTVSISIDDMPPSPMLMPKTSMRQQSTSLLGLVPVENDIQAEDV
eukprot:GGOE01053835.1.p1 GENE.GGOE01053835.1~~GGOE01053835.1.p1  ORF type:complete len:602 (+),score=186.96 GGOE01053835.1:138-1943(+)